MSVATTTEVTPTEAIAELLEGAVQTQQEATTNSINNTETQSVNNSESVTHGTTNVGGTLNIGGTYNASTTIEPFNTSELPNIYKWWEKSQQERGPGQGQPPELHVWQPTSAPLNRLTADNALLTEEPTVEIWAFTLSESETAQLARDVIHLMSEYMSEKYQDTEFADIVPSNVEDFREQKLRQRTDHYVYMVEVDIERETKTGIQ